MLAAALAASAVVCVTVFTVFLCLSRRRRRTKFRGRQRLTTIHRSPSVKAFDGANEPDNVQRRPVLGVEQEFSRDALCFLKTIGEGDFTKLMKGEASGLLHSDSVSTVLIKTLASTSPKAARRKFLAEISVLSRLEHANILPLLAVCSEIDPPCMIFDYSEIEDLKSYLLAANQVGTSGGDDSMFSMLRTPDLSGILLDIVMAVDYLQSRNICHTDISTRHCQVRSGGQVRLAPFQFIVPSKYTDDYCVVGDYEVEDGFRGARTLPVRWMAPESLEQGVFHLKSDIWALGVTAWEIFSFGATPYRGFSTDEVIDQVPSGQLVLSTPPQCPIQLWKVIRACLAYEPSKRIPASTLLRQVKQLHANISRSNVILDLGAVDGDIGDGLLISPVE
ncbi:muscle, skeletal receptor tyrosine-protein kinase-like [Sycon ciliatum]|uniref:muscle, skeletal receptor tyrosine-protein kinase-like n=1 Tax=Sycon ciliatum TaxID=27933 RepID=UPI0031F5FABD